MYANQISAGKHDPGADWPVIINDHGQLSVWEARNKGARNKAATRRQLPDDTGRA